MEVTRTMGRGRKPKSQSTSDSPTQISHTTDQSRSRSESGEKVAPIKGDLLLRLIGTNLQEPCFPIKRSILYIVLTVNCLFYYPLLEYNITIHIHGVNIKLVCRPYNSINTVLIGNIEIGEVILCTDGTETSPSSSPSSSRGCQLYASFPHPLRLP